MNGLFAQLWHWITRFCWITETIPQLGSLSDFTIYHCAIYAFQGTLTHVFSLALWRLSINWQKIHWNTGEYWIINKITLCRTESPTSGKWLTWWFKLIRKVLTWNVDVRNPTSKNLIKKSMDHEHFPLQATNISLYRLRTFPSTDYEHISLQIMNIFYHRIWTYHKDCQIYPMLVNISQLHGMGFISCQIRKTSHLSMGPDPSFLWKTLSVMGTNCQYSQTCHRGVFIIGMATGNSQ